MAEIPHILHQTYADARLPARLRRLQSTWREHHPAWTYRFWSDADIRAFVAKQAPDFVPIFDSYPHHIMRVDAFRYFLLYHQGGVYADLDYECRQPLEDLLQGKDILLVPEPPNRVGAGKAKQRGLPYVVSNALMASRPRHPFWLEVIRQLKEAKDTWDPLDATGPFMLTQAHAAFDTPIQIAPHRHFNAALSGAASQSKDVYAVHHWHGSWWRRPGPMEMIARSIKWVLHLVLPLILPNFQLRAYLAQHPPEESSMTAREETCRLLLYERGRIRADTSFACRQRAQEFNTDAKALPLVSALLITKERPQLAMRAVQCFLAQTYPKKELVIIDEGDHRFQREVSTLANPTIRYFRNEHKTNLGSLRNRAVRLARGEYVCQWDDDDLYHPQKISYQLAACRHYAADACFLLREMLQSGAATLGVSNPRLWEGSILARKTKMFHYLPMKRAEDYWVVHWLAKRRRVVALDLPELYIYTHHGVNTWSDHHFARVLAKADHIYFLESAKRAKRAELAPAYPHLAQPR